MASLEDYFYLLCPPRFPRAKTRRAKQKIAAKFGFRLIEVGRGNTLIDPDEGDRLLKEDAERRSGARRRGKTRAVKRVNISRKRTIVQDVKGRITGRVVEPIVHPSG
jgi:hypothetical protein